VDRKKLITFAAQIKNATAYKGLKKSVMLLKKLKRDGLN